MNKIIVAIILTFVVVVAGFLIINKNTSVNDKNIVPTQSPAPVDSSNSGKTEDKNKEVENEDENEKPISQPLPQPQQPRQQQPQPQLAPTVKKYTLLELSTHNTSASCWAAINNKVYDLTNSGRDNYFN